MPEKSKRLTFLSDKIDEKGMKPAGTYKMFAI